MAARVSGSFVQRLLIILRGDHGLSTVDRVPTYSNKATAMFPRPMLVMFLVPMMLLCTGQNHLVCADTGKQAQRNSQCGLLAPVLNQ
eukprot:1389385-Amphidinium_carterae.1